MTFESLNLIARGRDYLQVGSLQIIQLLVSLPINGVLLLKSLPDFQRLVDVDLAGFQQTLSELHETG